MAKKKPDETNKSKAIREFLAQAKGKVTARDAVAQLKEKGIEITEGLFYAVKNKSVEKVGKMKGKNAFRRHVAATTDMVSMAAVQKVKALIGEYGTDQIETIVKALK